MDTLRAYILSVAATAIVCALVQLFFEKDKNLSPIIRLVTGVVLTVAVISPLLKGELPNLHDYLDEITFEGERITAAGELAARRSMAERITERTTTYILDEATALGAEILVEVKLTADLPPVPVSVTLRGQVSPYTKKRLTQLIETDLGISEENQIWI